MRRPERQAIHGWFELTYSSYLVMHRTLLQSMPDEWQDRFVGLLEQLREAFAHVEQASSYWVRATDGRKFISEPVPDYSRGRTYVEPHATQIPLIAEAAEASPQDAAYVARFENALADILGRTYETTLPAEAPAQWAEAITAALAAAGWCFVTGDEWKAMTDAWIRDALR